jgi:chromosome segregation protein
MGASSAKILRGTQLTVVIFSGSSSRKPVGQATVELVFDNSDGAIGGEYAAYAEISLKRQVTRDGQSNYFINQTKCRRRDITGIFLGTGLGPRSYAIIEQGMVSRIIDAKPEDLRVYLEEAAGISKYKERRRETENRIQHTRDNLDRLSDLRQEIEKQLSRLERQSEAAQKYREYSDTAAHRKAQLLVLQKKKQETEMAGFDHHIRALNTQVEAVVSLQHNAQTRIEHARVQYTELSDALQAVQKEYYTLGSDIAKQELALSHHEERKTQLQEESQQISAALVKAEGQLGMDISTLSTLKTELATLQPHYQAEQQAREQAENAAKQAMEAMEQARSTWEIFLETSQKSKQQADIQKVKVSHLDTTIRDLETRYQKLQDELSTLNPHAIQEILTTHQAQQAQHENAVNALNAQWMAGETIIRSNRDALQQAEQQLQETQQAIQIAKGQQASLKALQEAAIATKASPEGFDNRARLAEVLNVEVGFETAVEAALAPFLDGFCVDALSEKGEGPFTFIAPLSETGLAQKMGHTSLASYVTTGLSYVNSWLSSVYYANSVNVALEQQSTLQAHESFMTQEGVWVGKNWIKTFETADPKAGILKRENSLQTLEEVLVEKNSLFTTLRVRLETARTTLRDAEQAQTALNQQRNLLVQDMGSLKALISREQTRLEQTSHRMNRLDRDMADNRTEVAITEQALQEARRLLDEAIQAMSSDENQRQALSQIKQTCETHLFEENRKYKEINALYQGSALQKARLTAQIEATHQSMIRIEEQVATLIGRETDLTEQLAEHDNPLPALQQQLAILLGNRLKSEQQLNQARAAVGHVEATLRELEQEKMKAALEQEQFRNQLEQVRLNWQTLSVKRQAIEEQLVKLAYTEEELQLPETITEEILTAEVETLERKIERLGPINLAAIEEFTSEKERKQYLDTQNADLTEALQVLEDAIRKIDKETRARFQETYQKVSEAFQNLFPRLFGGGQAVLELTGEDLLDTGVSIVARPPGKKNSLLSQLSGGEKALTAVALVFAIFQLNPAPFCMLDEVDAPDPVDAFEGKRFHPAQVQASGRCHAGGEGQPHPSLHGCHHRLVAAHHQGLLQPVGIHAAGRHQFLHRFLGA